MKIIIYYTVDQIKIQGGVNMNKYLVTADIHIERVIKEGKYDDMVKYFTESIESVMPKLFIIAGDITDSRNMRIESDDAILLQKFLMTILDSLKSIRSKLLIIRGTPSHDGDVIKSMYTVLNKMYDNVFYVDKIDKIYLNGTNILCIPEIYTPTYEDFLEELNSVVDGDYFDLVVFHSMIDFAIPAVNQIDSKFNVSRCVVISSDTLEHLGNICIGGHVHSFISNKNIYYTGRFINETNQRYDKDVFGLKLVTLTSHNTHIVENIENPYLIKQKTISLDFDKMSQEEISDVVHSIQQNNIPIIYECKYTIGVTEDKFNDFIKTYNPKIVKKIKQGAVKDGVKRYSQSKISSDEDVLHVLKDVYKRKFGEDIPEEIINMIVDKTESE